MTEFEELRLKFQTLYDNAILLYSHHISPSFRRLEEMRVLLIKMKTINDNIIDLIIDTEYKETKLKYHDLNIFIDRMPIID